MKSLFLTVALPALSAGAFAAGIQLDPQGRPVISYQSSAGSYFLLQRSTDPSSFTETVSLAPAQSGERTMMDPAPPPGRQFYIVKAVDLFAPLDLDADGINDVLELNSPVLDPLNAADALEDYDGDARTNRRELEEGTDPALANPAPPAAVVESAPFDGEESVGLTRRVIVYFSSAVNPVTVNAASLSLTANGSPLAAAITVSPTEKFATLIANGLLPAATELTAVVRGDLIMARDGRALDADRDGSPGGTLTFSFRTLPNQQIAGTGVFGYVLDSMSQQPISGVRVTVDGLTSVNAVTDATGRFQLNGVPSPQFFVRIDGRLATNPPPGFTYPTVSKKWTSVPGRLVQVNEHGVPFTVFLPKMAPTDYQPLNAAAPSVVTFGPAAAADVQAMVPGANPAAMQLVIPPGSARDEFGNAGTSASIIAVPPGRLPAPLPMGATPRLVVSIQVTTNFGLGRASRFDTPAPFAFPNLDNLPPGAGSVIFSFDHESGVWQPIGTATVNEDGTQLISDPGTGIRAPGWHFADPRRSPRGDKPLAPPSLPAVPEITPPPAEPQTPGPPPPFASPPGTSAGMEIHYPNSQPDHPLVVLLSGGGPQGRLNTDEDGVFNVDLLPGIPWTAEAYDPRSDTTRTASGTAAPAGTPTSVSFSPPVPATQQVRAASLASTWLYDFGTATSPLSPNYQRVDNSAASTYSAARGNGWTSAPPPLASDDSHTAGLDAVERDHVVASALHEFAVDLPNGSYDVLLTAGDGRSRRDNMAVSVEGVTRFVLSTGQPGTVSAWARVDVTDRQMTFRFADSERESAPVPVCAIEIYQVRPSAVQTPVAEEPRALSGRFYVAVEEVDTRVVHRFTSDISAGEFLCAEGNLLVPALARCRQWAWHVDSGMMGFSSFRATGLSTIFNQPAVMFHPVVDGDADSDGLPDIAEFIVGSNPNLADSDGDGIRDDQDIVPPNEPLGPFSMPAGVTARLSTPQPARAVAVEQMASGPRLAFLATGSHGLDIVDVSEFDAPIRVGQLDLPGTAVDVAVDAETGRAVVACGSGGLVIVDVSSPGTAEVTGTLTLNAVQTVMYQGLACVAHGSSITAVDPVTGLSVGAVTLPDGAVRGMARDGDFLYCTTSTNKLRIVAITGGGRFALRGVLQLAAGGGQVFAGDGTAWVAAASSNIGGYSTVDVRDPDNPVLISGSDAVSADGANATAIVPNGSGTGLMAGFAFTLANDPRSIQILNLTDHADTWNFRSQISLAGLPYDAAIHSGVAFVAGEDGLVVANYLPFDTGGVAPSVNIAEDALDANPGAAGVQVVQGSRLTVRSTITDDVQVRFAELLINGSVVATDYAYPFELSGFVPAAGNSVNIIVRATDTGGNVASDAVTASIVTDAAPPVLAGTNPGNGAFVNRTRRQFAALFSESMDAATLTPAAIQLKPVAGGPALTPASFRVTESAAGSLYLATFDAIPAGAYQMEFNAAMLRDRAGNAMGGENPVRSFTVVDADAAWSALSPGAWHDPAGWDSGMVPENGADIFLPDGADVTVEQDGVIQLNSLTGAGSGKLTLLQSSTLEVATPISVPGGILMSIRGSSRPTLRNSTIAAGTTVSLDATGWFENVTVAGEIMTRGQTAMLKGITLTGGTLRTGNGGTFRMEGTQTLAGTGEVILNTGSLDTQQDMTLTIAPGITIRALGTNCSLGDGYSPTSASMSIINRGTIIAGGTGRLTYIARAAGTFTNPGTLRIENGMNVELGRVGAVGAETGVTGTVQFTGAGGISSLIVTSGDYAVNAPLTLPANTLLSLGGTWANASTIAVQGGTLEIEGAGNTLTRIGNLTRSGGTVRIAGRLVLGAGETLALNDTTGSWQLYGGAIEGGRITTAGAAKLLAVSDTTTSVGDSQLLNTTLAGSMENTGKLILSGLTLDGGFLLSRSGTGTLQISGAQTWAGSGEIRLAEAGDVTTTGGGFALTIASGVTLSGAGNIIAGTAPCSVVNAGTIRADVSGSALNFSGSGMVLTNNGTLRAESGGHITIASIAAVNAVPGRLGAVSLADSGNAAVPSRVTVNGGGPYAVNVPVALPPNTRLQLGGDVTNAAGVTLNGGTFSMGGALTLARIGAINRTAGNFALNGVLTQAAGDTLVLNDTTGSWTLESGGGITGGTVTAGGSAQILVSASAATPAALRQCVLNSPVSVPSGSSLVTDAVTINQTLTVAGGTLRLAGSPTLGGTGSIRLEDGGNIVMDAAPGTVTVGPSFTISGRGNIGTTGPAMRLINQGSIVADVPAGVTNLALSIHTASQGVLENSGTLRSENGALFFIGRMGDSGASPGVLGSVVLSGNGRFTVNSVTSPAAPGNPWILNQPLTIPAGSQLALGGNWQNTATISVTGGTLNLAGSAMTLTNIGTLTRAGGNVNLTGSLTLGAGETLALTAATGSWNLGSNAVLSGGSITTSGGAVLTSSGGTSLSPAILQNTTLTGELQITGGHLRFSGLTLGGALNVTGTAVLRCDGTQTIHGSGTLTLSGQQLLMHTAGTLTLGPDITLRGWGNVGTSGAAMNLVNQGTIIADSAGKILRLGTTGGTFTNTGSAIEENGGILTIDHPAP